jgi:tetratricopeptide (TPR) repeat protein
LRASERTVRVTERVGIFLREDGKFGDSEKLLSRAVKIFSEVSGDDDESTLRSHAQLAWTYVELGRPEQAAEILQSTLSSLKVLSFGNDHPDTLRVMMCLAATYFRQGTLDDAFALDEQVLNACRKFLGEDHPDTLRAKINLAGSYCERRKWDSDAAMLGKDALDGCRRVVGEDHPDTMAAMSTLAIAYGHQGRGHDSEALAVKTLIDNKRVLGEDHPNTLKAMGNLAKTYLQHERGPDVAQGDPDAQ